jgi:hypothetical protein
MGDRFKVDPTAVDGLADNGFTAEATDLRTALAAFESTAGQIFDAFGLLGACDGAMQQYTGLLDTTTTALGRIAEALDGDAERLHATAAEYRGNEQRTHGQFRTLHEAF